MDVTHKCDIRTLMAVIRLGAVGLFVYCLLRLLIVIIYVAETVHHATIVDPLYRVGWLLVPIAMSLIISTTGLIVATAGALFTRWTARSLQRFLNA